MRHYIPTPVLVASFGRSGSTLLMSVLSQIDTVFVPDKYPFERRYLNYFLHMINTCFMHDRQESISDWLLKLRDMELDVIGPCPYLDNDVFEDLWLTKKAVASKLLAANLVTFLNELHPIYSNKKFWAEKGFEQDHILGKFSIDHRRVIILIRHPCDLFISMCEFGNLTSEDFDKFIIGYGVFLENAKKWGRTDPRNIVVRYEDLVLRESECINTIASFLDQSKFIAEESTSSIPKSHMTSVSAQQSIGRYRNCPSQYKTFIDAILQKLSFAIGEFWPEY
jgi:hypothetical protein